jgi:hypothetical protein
MVKGYEAQALRCMSLVIAGVPAHAERLMAARVEGPRGPVPAVQILLKVALDGREAAERAAADAVIRAFCSGNLEGQTTLAATLMPMGGLDAGTPGETDATFGAEVLRALSSPDAALCARGAATLQHLLVGNSAAKERVLRMTLPLPQAGGSNPGADAPSQLLPFLVARVLSILTVPNPRATPICRLYPLSVDCNGCPLLWHVVVPRCCGEGRSLVPFVCHCPVVAAAIVVVVLNRSALHLGGTKSVLGVVYNQSAVVLVT